MSLFRRKLLAKRGGGDKPNLAVVTSASTAFSGDKKIPVTANLKKGKDYNLSFDCTVYITKKSESGITIGQYTCWKDGRIVVLRDLEVGQSYTRSFSGVRTCYSDRNAARIDAVLSVLGRGCEGTATINNLVITEV